MPMWSVALSVRQKLILTSLLAMFGVLCILGIAAHAWNTASELDKIDAFLIADSGSSAGAIATAITELVEDTHSPAQLVNEYQLIEYLKTFIHNRLNRPAIYKTTMLVTTVDHVLLAASNDALPIQESDLSGPQAIMENRELQEDGSTLVSVHRGSLTYRLIVVPIRIGQTELASLRLACLLSPASDSALLFDRSMIAILILIAGFSTIGSFILITRTLRPVEEMRLAAERITERSLDRRLPQPAGNDEIAGLARTFNHFLNRIEAAYQFQIRVVDDLSHQLRTPLTILRGSIDLLLRRDPKKSEYRRTMEDCLADIDRMSSFLVTMLSLARLESQVIPLRLEPLNVMNLIEEMLEEMSALWQENGQVVRVELLKSEEALSFRLEHPNTDYPLELTAASAPIITVDRIMFSQALMNIYSNAFKYCLSGGRICTYLCTQDTDNQRECIILITNTGPAIAEADLPKIFDRFYRGEHPAYKRSDGDSQETQDVTSHTQGFGLGLNIALNIVGLHHGSIKAFNPAAGGSAFEIHIPY